MKEKDLRQKDNELLEGHGILQDWQVEWEKNIFRITHSDKNQELWSISKRSFLAGWLLARKALAK